MKRIGNLMVPEKVTIGLCMECIKAAARNKTVEKRAGFIQSVLNNKEYYAAQLQQIALNPYELFEPHEYVRTTIIDRGKERELDIPAFWPDQCMHHLLIELIKDFALPRIDTYAVACVEGRGLDYGIKAIKSWMQFSNRPDECEPHTGRPYNELKMLDTRYYIQGDIKKCFPSLKKEIIMRELRGFVKDPKWLYIMEAILDKGETLPIGISMSGWIINIILRHFDSNIRAVPGVTHYLRYVDDFLIFARQWKTLKEIQPLIYQWLAYYGLQPKPMQIVQTDLLDPDILGHNFHREFSLLRKSNWIPIRNGIESIEEFARAHSLDLHRKEDLVYTYDHYPSELLVALNSKISFSKKDRNSRLDKFMANRGYRTMLRNGSRAQQHLNPVDIHGHQISDEKMDFVRSLYPLMDLNDISKKPVMTFVDIKTGQVVDSVLRKQHPLNPLNKEYLRTHKNKGTVPREVSEKNVKEFYKNRELAKQKREQELQEQRHASHEKMVERLQENRDRFLKH